MAKRFFSFLFPVKGDTKGEVVRKLIFIAAFVVLVVCVVKLSIYYADSLSNDAKNRQLARAFKEAPSSSSSSTVSSKYPAGMLPKFQPIYDQNSDVKGWLTIPGTAIDYPVAEAADNDYYLTKGFDKQDNDHGALFLDYRDSVSPQSKNLIIYGHNMKDGQMFHDLRYYQNIDTYSTSSLITFDTIYGEYKWKVFAAFWANTEPTQGYVFNYLITDWSTDSAFTSFITEVKARSMFNIPVDVQPGDSILTLSTCAYEFEGERLVVMARLVRSGEDLGVGTVTENKSSLGPKLQMK
jgi:sortase B